MNKEFQTLRKKQRFGLRKLNIGVASVLLGFTIFGYNLASQAPVAHAATSTVQRSGAPGVVSGSPASNSQTTSATSSAATASQATPANSGNATSSPASQAGTTSANHTASNTNTTPSSQTVSVNETTSSATQARTLMMKFPATQARTLMMKFPAAQSRIFMTNLAVRNLSTADDLPKSAQNSGTDTTLPTTTQTYTPVYQPLLYDYMLHGRDGKTWVDKTLGTGIRDYRGNTLDTIFGTTSKPGIIASNTADKYFFAAYVDFSEPYHRVILLARSQDPSDKNLYSYTIHTNRQKTSTTTIKPGDSTKEQYTGVAGIGRSTYDLIFHNYGDSFTVKLNGFKEGYGLLPVFDGGLLDPTYGSNSYDQNNKAAETKSIGFWASAIPQETSTKVRYVDQATGKDIVQPMVISGFGYQGFKVNGEAPTVKGYHLVSSPKSLGLPYEDGTIAPYKVGQTYDLPLSNGVVIKQTVLDTDGFVRATAYYKGSPLSTYYKGSALSTSTSKVLGRESDNNSMSFFAPDGQWCTYTNRIGQVDDSYIYYYAKDTDPKGSEMRLHFIDVTGVNNSSYAPSDGPELDADNVQTSHGNIGEHYSFTYTVPKGYDQVGTSDVTGTYSVTHHDAYVYVKKYTVAAGKPVTLTHGQKVKAGDSLDSSAVTLKDAKGQAVSLPDGAKVVWATAPATSEVGNDKTGQAKVVYGDNSESEPVTVTYNVTKNDADKYPLTQGTPVKVNDPANLTTTEKGQVSAGIKQANPTAPIQSITVNDDGSAAVTFNDGSTTTVSANVTKKQDADKYPLTQGTPVKVNDPANLTTTEKGQVSAGIKQANPTAPIQSITVNDDGSAAVTFNDGSTTTVSANVTKKQDADKYPLTQGTPVKVNDPANLTTTEKGQVSAGIKQANPTAPIQSITVNDDGSAAVTFNDGSTTTVSANVTKKQDADKYPLTQGTPVKVNDPANLTTTEKGQVSAGIKQANPTAPIQSITVNDDGSAAVTFNDGSTTTVSANVTKKQDADKYPLTQGTPVKVNDPANLTTTEKGQVSAGIKQANPTAPIQSITVNDDGSAAVTFNDGSTTTVSANVTKKQDADKYPLTQGTPVKVNDPANLTTTEKGQVSAGIKQANPTAPIQSITVNDDGSAAVTFNDGSTTTVSANVTKKQDADKYPLTQGTPVKVNDPANLTTTEKGQVSAGIKQANPTAPIQSITVNDDGSAAVTFNDGSTTTVSANVTKKQDADKYPLTQGTPVKVNDPANLTTTEKGQVSAGIKQANPTAPIQSITVNDDGSAAVTFNDGSTTTVSANVTKKQDADKYPLTQGTPVKVNDPANLTTTEKGQVSAGIKQANPTAPIQSITVNDDGSAAVTFNDGSTTTVSANVTKKQDADKYPLTQGTPVKVNDPANLTTTEKGQVSAGIKQANPTAPIQSITVNDDGSAAVTFNDGSTTTVSANVTKKQDADKYPLTQGTPVKVNDPANLTTTEKGQVSAGIKQANPTAPIQSITVNDDGSAAVTFNDGSTTTVSANVTKKQDADKYPLTQGTPVKVNDPANLTTTEKGQVSAGIKQANPTAPIQSITVNDDGSAAVTFNDGSTTTVSANVTKKQDADKYPLTQGTPVKVNDPANLTTTEKGQVSAGIKQANPTAPIQSITVNDDGSAAVTFNDGSTTTVSANVTKKQDADKYPLTQGTPVKVNDPANLTTTEKGQVSAGIKQANPTAPIQSITVNDDGSAAVTFNDGSTTTVSANVTKKQDADKYPLTQGTPVKVNDPANLTTTEKGQVSAGIKQANPTAPIQSITVNDDGSAAVTFNDGSTTTVSANVTKKQDADKYPLTQGTPVKVNDPANLTTTEKGQVSAGIKQANPTAPIQSITVNDDGSAAVTFNDGSTTTVSANVTKKQDADKYPLTQGTPVKVNDPANLTTTEKGQVSAGIKQANPTAPIQSITVNDDGSAAVTFNDGSTTTVSANVTKKQDADKYPLTQGTPVKVNDPANLTTTEKGQVSAGIKQANPTAPIQSITVNDDGSAAVTFNDGSTTTVSANVTKKQDADKYPLTQGTPVKVNDPANLTTTEKGQVSAGIKQANPTAPIQSITVNDDGSAAVTFNDGSTTTVSANVTKKQDADKYPLTQGTPVKVNDPANLTTTEKGQVSAGIKQANPTAPIQSITVNDDGSAAVTFNDGSTTTVSANVTKKQDADKYPLTQGTPVKVNDPANLTTTEKGQVSAGIKQANPTAPIQSITVNDDGSAAVTFNDGSTTTVSANVTKKQDADKYPLTQGTPVKVNDPANLTTTEKGQVSAGIKQANPTAPIQSITVNDDGSAAVTFNDGSTTTVSANVTKKQDADKYPLTQGTPVKVNDPANLTTTEKGQVSAGIKQANPTAPIQSITVNDDGSAAVTFNDGSTTTVSANVTKKQDADKYPLTQGTPVKVNDPANLTTTEKGQVSAGIKQANPTAPIQSITVNDDGSAAVTFNDGSTTTVSANVIKKTDKSNYTVTAGQPVTLTHGQQVKAGDSLDSSAVTLKDAKGQTVSLPDGAKVVWTTAPATSEVGNDKTGQAKVVYGDNSESEPVTVTYNVTPNDADQYTPTVPAKTKVDDLTKLTAGEKKEVEDKVTEANKDQFPAGTQVTIGNDGTATITYPDKSVDTIEGNKLVEAKTDTPTPTEKTVNVVFKGVDKKYDGKPAEVTVTITDQDGKDVDVTLEAGKDYTITKQSAAKARMLLATAKPLTDAPTEVGTYHVALTEAGKQKLKDAGYTTVNETPADFTISPADTSTPTPDTKTDDEKYDPIIPGDKVKVDDPTKLTNEEKDEVVKAVEDANKDDNGNSTLPDGTKITVDDNGDVTVTYPDGSEDTIPGDKVVEGKTDADKNEPNVPSEDDKVKVDDPTKLTDGEKEDVVKAVEDANKDKDGNSTLPDGTKITVGDNGDVTVTYPDGSKDTIPGDKVVEGKTDADKTDVTVPGTKVEVGDPTKLTDGEKGQVEEAIKDANPNLPDGTKITVADDGTATILYPDGSYKVIDGQDLVTKPGQTTADQVTPVVPGDKVTVVDPNHLTDAEKDQVKTNVEKANQNNFPAGTVVMVADDGTATITYPDGSVDQISAADLITKPMAAGQAGKGTGTTTTNGQGAPAGQGKADQAKTLPQTGNEQGSLLAASGLGMLLLGLLGLGGKRKKED